jgi:hypothetical protein
LAELADELAVLRERRRGPVDLEGNEAVADSGDSAESLRRAEQRSR